MSRLLLTEPPPSQHAHSAMATKAPEGPRQPSGVSSRADRYLKRVDKLLTHFPAGARNVWLTSALDTWERKYAAFIATCGATEYCAPGAEPITTHDFLLTITGLAARRDQCRARHE